MLDRYIDLMSKFIHHQAIERQKTDKTLHNKHQNAIDMKIFISPE